MCDIPSIQLGFLFANLIRRVRITSLHTQTYAGLSGLIVANSLRAKEDSRSWVLLEGHETRLGGRIRNSEVRVLFLWMPRPFFHPLIFSFGRRATSIWGLRGFGLTTSLKFDPLVYTSYVHSHIYYRTIVEEIF